MIFPKTELKFISDEIGYGVVATEFIPKGTITWALDALDREFSPQQYNGMSQKYQQILSFYTYRNNRGNYVLCWDHGRYVNHSFNSNCITTAYDFEIAVRDIYPGEQLTDDYGYLNVEEPFEALDEGHDRKVVYPDDLERYHADWDNKLRDAFPLITQVDQPLKHLVDPKLWAHIEEIASGEKQMKSILDCLYRP
ncbi:MAG: SET domain-containing protein [Flavobacteriales bacterium]|nr:SET domain-containing protein [Flavobacteriales bacterium]